MVFADRPPSTLSQNASASEPMKMHGVSSRRVDTSRVALLLLWAFATLICILGGFNASIHVDFYPINGTFQNYNVWRRLLSGQIPFYEFKAYLGGGHLILGGLLTWMKGGSFSDSLFVGSFLSRFFSVCSIYIVARLITRSKLIGISVAVMMVTFYKMLPENFAASFVNAMNACVETGNSARPIRSGCIPIFGMLTLFLHDRIHFKGKSAKLLKRAILSAFAGLLILYSNDFGIAAYISASFVYFIHLIKTERKVSRVLGWTGFWILASAMGWMFGAAVITRGHVGSYLSTMLGTAGYQFWYYSEMDKLYFISDLRQIGLPLSATAIVAIYNLVRYLADRRQDAEKAVGRLVLSFCYMSGCVATLVYAIISGAIMKENLLLLVSVGLIAYAIRAIMLTVGFFKAGRNKMWARLGMGALLLCLSLGGVSSLVDTYSAYKNVAGAASGYSGALGGYYTGSKRFDAIEHVAERLKGQSFFSTYASALEVIGGQFQPSGTDYIIHVLGDGAREQYLQAFHEGNYRYVVNISSDTINWGYWIRNANWFFFRELFRDYSPVMSENYIELWEKNQNGSNILDVAAQVSAKQIDERTVKIVCTAAEPVNAIVDLRLSYHSDYRTQRLQNGLLHRLVHVENVTQKERYQADRTSYNLPDAADGINIPVMIHNGVGEVNIQVYPEGYATLTIEDAVVNSILKNPFDE
jgi:hypothetical protein